MYTKYRDYRVGLVLSKSIQLEDYVLKIDGQEYNICFYSNEDTLTKYCDLVITDKNPCDLNDIPKEISDCHGITLIFNKISNPLLEQQYDVIFPKSQIKYRTISDFTPCKISKSVNSELIKYLVRENSISPWVIWFSPYTRRELTGRVLDISWLLIPFIILLLYYFVRYVGTITEHQFTPFLCWFVDYDPNCKGDILQELRLFTLIYAIFNLKFYYDYILSIFDNINNDVFQFTRARRVFHKSLQFMIPLLLFASLTIILKAIFVFKYSFSIADENGLHINIQSILDKRLPFLTDNLIIWYFLVLDFCLYLITRNFSITIKTIPQTFSSNRQKGIIKNAQSDFGTSVVCDFSILILSSLLFNFLITDQQSVLAIQLILLQLFYLSINISTIVSDFKHN